MRKHIWEAGFNNLLLWCFRCYLILKGWSLMTSILDMRDMRHHNQEHETKIPLKGFYFTVVTLTCQKVVLWIFTPRGKRCITELVNCFFITTK